eukprot:TRINITY_DN8462_c0_g1_i1.p1 TRINITY_DN8462_c0_g1~~TRINITY_DN8462_c0_g1_i1.p1  ORF type:complete len:145 (-),score=24.20 TRINITY_DN8462_c0_g1_i1:99-533(-)
MTHLFRGVGRVCGIIPHRTYANDVIRLKGLVFFGRHGVYAEEKTLGQKFRVDVSLQCDLLKAGQTDNLQDTVNYGQIYRSIQEIVEGAPCNLLETVASKIADKILSQHTSVSKVTVSVEKPQVKFPGFLDCVGVEITREAKRDS